MKKNLLSSIAALAATAIAGLSCSGPDISNFSGNRESIEEQYSLVPEEWDAAFEFLSRTDLDTLKAGRYELTDRTYASVQELTTKTGGKWEAHRNVVDIFFIIKGEQNFLLTPYENLKEIIKPYGKRDVELFANATCADTLRLTAGKGAIIFPEDGHLPHQMVGQAEDIKLVLVKVPYVRRSLGVIPEPASVKWGKGSHSLSTGCHEKCCAGCAEKCCAEKSPKKCCAGEAAPEGAGCHEKCCAEKSPEKCCAASVKFSKRLPSEAYEIRITPSEIKITAGGESGALYARQTLCQMRATHGDTLPCCTIKDAPRFAWRGFMLDESRHFRGKEYVKRTLDMMVHFKLNKFHWHLTDSQGWRIQIDAYPELTSIGAIGNNTDPAAPALFYTKDEIREIISYAAALGIEVIPEIDMPGHATAAVRAYPVLSGGNDTKRFPDFTFNVGSEYTYEFLQKVLDEVAELFPSEYIHLGADEVSFGNEVWNRNQDIQALIAREGLDGLKGAEGYFVRRMAEYVKSIGKKPILWDDALNVGIGNDATIMWWRHDVLEHLRQAVGEGYPTILCPRLPCYFDYVQADNHVEGPKRSGYCNEVVQAYLFPDYPNKYGNIHKKEPWGLSEEALDSVLGIQGNLWTERVDNDRRADFMIWPRLCALSEAAWSQPEVKNYADFRVRMDKAFEYFDRIGAAYYDFRDPSRTPEPAQPEKYRNRNNF
ncbi:MAG: YhcH/YjgK/YiaL family protein [Candidatus Cryptobacteroides sp.]|nr:YhcH/YjgK/YiaL family protein [Candidatus Cryptobacteroides sp.]